MTKTFYGLGLALLFASVNSAAAYSESCQLVAHMAGNKEYVQKPMRVASLLPAHQLPANLSLRLLQNHGAWYIYRTPEPWFDKENCAPLNVEVTQGASATLQFMPVLANLKTGNSAVVLGNFVIKVYREKHLQEVIDRYGFKTLSPLPNPESMIVDVKPTDSYDQLLLALDKDKDVELALPLLSEPRGR